MIKVRRKGFKLTPEIFQVRYLGSTLTTEPGPSGMEKAVRIIQNEAKTKDKTCSKMKLEITSDGIKFIQESPQYKENKFIALEKISYGTMTKENANIFAFNHHSSRKPFVVECHAVVCESEEKAKQIGIALYAAFRGGHFERLRNERRRSKERSHNQEQFLSSDLQDSTERLSTTSTSSRGSTSSHGSSDGDDNISLSAEQSCLTIDIGYEEQELNKIVQDMLNTVEKEKALLK